MKGKPKQPEDEDTITIRLDHESAGALLDALLDAMHWCSQEREPYVRATTVPQCAWMSQRLYDALQGSERAG